MAALARLLCDNSQLGGYLGNLARMMSYGLVRGNDENGN